ncbi:LAETG motif-containing sortase-dependent surface protein [Streptomyces sp. V4-01]|uniref:LAETG motif-containing sortase-dependent surface protein n=1 Tax=Actinacidiphila polyblastidii TaxID=3110430 RepID=A0ABU7P5R5_9ACTN|nr:LAETG motif-containing sortase-dependent surface protein [Streptomyces sp. V4-01]
MRATTRRAIGVAAGIGSITAAITLGGIGTASASDDGSDCGQTAGVQYKVDGGHWTRDGRINGDTPPSKITVKLTENPEEGCQYRITLASYTAEGPSWDSSGLQTYLTSKTITLYKGHTKDTLDISGSTPTCFGQVDLYGNPENVVYDGQSGEGHGALPHFPDSYTPPHLITAWNGGHKCDDQTPTPTPTETTDTPTPTPTDTTDSPTPTPTDTTDTPTPTPTDTTGTPSPSPSVSDTASPSPSASTPTGTPTSTAAPTGTPSVPPATSSSGTGNLAETGSNSSQNVAFAGGGAALLVAGGAAVYFTRRRRSGSHS